MSKILLVDADSKIPNLPVMKLSTYHKALGDSVDFIRLDIPYYPTQKRAVKRIPTGYDKTYCSVVYSETMKFIETDAEVEYGGTGYSLSKKLPDEIEYLDCDYSLYPDNKISYGYITRGCFRNCYFCNVFKKEGLPHQVNTIDRIVKHKKTNFLDSNILAFSGHKEILKELVEKNIRHKFNQGYDIRLIDEENSELIRKCNCLVRIFAFDDINLESTIEEKLKLMEWRGPWDFVFYVYVSDNMKLFDTVYRIEWLRNKKIHAYIMRDLNCFYGERNKFYIDLSAWCNQHKFKHISFEEFLKKRVAKESRKIESLDLYNKAKKGLI